jgi:dihydrolipoamide dehydrogenase
LRARRHRPPPNTEGLALDKAGLTSTRAARSKRIHDFRTSVPASGPSATSIPGPMLAHKAEDEGIAVAEISPG